MSGEVEYDLYNVCSFLGILSQCGAGRQMSRRCLAPASLCARMPPTCPLASASAEVIASRSVSEGMCASANAKGCASARGNESTSGAGVGPEAPNGDDRADYIRLWVKEEWMDTVTAPFVLYLSATCALDRACLCFQSLDLFHYF